MNNNDFLLKLKIGYKKQYVLIIVAALSLIYQRDVCY